MSGDSSSLKNVGSPLGIYFSLLKVNVPQFSLLKVNVAQSFMNSTRAAMPLGVASKMLFWCWAHTFCWLFSSTYLLYKEDLDPPDCSHQLWTKCKIYNVLKNRHWQLEHSKGNWSFWWGFESVIILFFLHYIVIYLHIYMVLLLVLPIYRTLIQVWFQTYLWSAIVPSLGLSLRLRCACEDDLTVNNNTFKCTGRTSTTSRLVCYVICYRLNLNQN